MILIGAVFAFLQFTTFGMVVRAGMADRETVGLLGINIDRRFTVMFGIAAAVAGLAGVMYTPINPPNYHMGMDFLVISFVVVVVGGMGTSTGAMVWSMLNPSPMVCPTKIPPVSTAEKQPNPRMSPAAMRMEFVVSTLPCSVLKAI